MWSQINRDNVARLVAAGRMTPHRQRQVDAAKADGRWDAAYAPIRATTDSTIPDDLRAAIESNPRAKRTFRTLSKRLDSGQGRAPIPWCSHGHGTGVGQAPVLVRG